MMEKFLEKQKLRGFLTGSHTKKETPKKKYLGIKHEDMRKNEKSQKVTTLWEN